MQTTLRPAAIALVRAEARLIERLEQLEKQRANGDDTAIGIEYAQLAAALATIAPLTSPGAAGRAMTTAELGAAFHLAPRTARRKGLRGDLPVAPIRLGPGGRSKLRWAAQ